VYAQSGLDPDEMLPPVRKAFDWALEWAAMGSNGQQRAADDSRALARQSLRQQKTPPSGAFQERMMGLEPTTFSMARRRSSQLSYIRERGAV
jgi:hypothetical protein